MSARRRTAAETDIHTTPVGILEEHHRGLIRGAKPLMSHQSTAWPTRPAASSFRAAEAPPKAPVLPTWLTNGLLALASCVLLALACASAWLSYHAQVSYVLAHNGNQAAEARIWALLLDTGTAGVSLLSLYEALRRRPGVATRISLLGCIAASVTMNVLHAPARSPGGYLVAAVPPVMYAVFLEHLLANLRSLLIADEQRRTPWRTLVLWINFPLLMWSGRRGSLRRDAESDLVAAEFLSHDSAAAADLNREAVHEVEQVGRGAEGGQGQRRVRSTSRGRGPGAKRIAFEAALAEQVRCGDRRLFSKDERERNAAAYEAAVSLPVPLSRGAARRYVVQALPRLEGVGRAPVPRPPSA